jgi:hypothetical protein
LTNSSPAAVNEETLKKSVDEIALTQGALRAIHLKRHLLVRTILDGEQLTKYAQLRGYTADGSMPAHRHPH